MVSAEGTQVGRGSGELSLLDEALIGIARSLKLELLLWTILQVDELKQHIKILQAVGYNAMEGEDVSPVGGVTVGGDNHGVGPETTSVRSLEALLLAKNRHLEHELTMARLQVADLTGELVSVVYDVAWCLLEQLHCIASATTSRTHR